MRKLAVLVLILFSMILVAPVGSSSVGTFTLRVVNNSEKDIHRVHIAWSGTGRWGPDRLGKEILRAGGSTQLTNIVPGDYDLLFVDTKENQCVFRKLPIYHNRSWSITREWISRCPD